MNQAANSLTDDELAALDAFILALDGEEGCLPVDEAHGYLTARQITGHTPLEGDWMQEIWGSPTFETPEQAGELSGLLEKLAGDVLTSLASEGPFEPLVAEIEEDGQLVEAYEGWCFGFMLAASNDEARWETLPKNEQSLLAPIAKLAMLYTEEDFDLDDEEYGILVELIPGSVRGLRQYWESVSLN